MTYEISRDPSRLDLDLIHRFLSEEAYWSPGVPREVVERAVANSLCFAAYTSEGAQVAFARLVTDRATFAYLSDVFVLAPHRGKGISKLLMTAIVADPELRGMRRWMLATRDAHALYAQFGFKPLANPPRFMERHDPDVYAKQ